jgi:membrane fusion protein, copper/silver efflux system
MKRKGMIVVAGVAASVVILLGIGYYFNPGGVVDKVRAGLGRSAAPGMAPATGHEGHTGGPPAAMPPAAEPQTGEKPAAGAQAVETPTVEITPERQQMIGVKTAAVALRPLRRTIRTVGRIEYDERLFRTVTTKVEGWIERLYVDYTGRPVKKGEPLVDIYSPELLATQREFLQILKWSRDSKAEGPGATDRMISRDAQAIAAAARERLKLWDISEEQIRRIEETGEPVRTLTIYSPVSGHVIQKMAVQGMRAMPGEKLFDVAELATLWVIADVYEPDLPFIRPDQEAVITLVAYPGQEYRSRVEFINPTLAGDTRTAKVRFAITNPGGKLKPQMYTDVEIKIDLGQRLTIPDDAAIDTGLRQIVYVDKGDGNFEPREVQLGARAEGLREVLRGLKAGEKVAQSAAFLVDSEAQLRGVKPLERGKR